MTENMENIIEGDKGRYRFVIQELEHLIGDIAIDPKIEDLEEDIDSVLRRINDLKGDDSIKKDLVKKWSDIEKGLKDGSLETKNIIESISSFKEYISGLK